MVARLVAEEGDLKGLILSFENGDQWVIGRDPEQSQLVIEDPLVSQQHLIVRRTAEGIVVQNLSDTNPIQINGEDIDDQPQLLLPGDSLKIGNQLFRFYAEALAEALAEEEPKIEETAAEEEPKSAEEEPSAEEEHMREELAAEEELMIEEPKSAEEEPIREESIPEQPIPPPSPPPSPATYLNEEDDILTDTVLEEGEEKGTLAEINFGIVETGRWLLKVIGGPNNGAEFYMQSGHSYILGTDPHTCDIVFHDTSVSRQHAKITVTPEETLLIEDLKSRNGILINGSAIEEKQDLPLSTIITLGTTSFVVYDREGEMQTIISPLLPSIVKVLQQEEPAKIQEVAPFTSSPEPVEDTKPVPPPVVEAPPPKKPRQFGPLIFLATIFGLFALAGIGTTALFKAEPIAMQTHENEEEQIQQAISHFPAVRHVFNKANGTLLLLGHVSTAAEKSQLDYNLLGLKFIKSVNDKDIIIDEYVWQEVNSILGKTWKGITIHSPSAGQFVLSGELQTRKQGEQLSSYMNLNFPYLDLLKKQIVIEEDIVNQIQGWLREAKLTDVVAKMTNGEISLTGKAPSDKLNELNSILAKVKQIPGVRVVNNLIQSQAPEMGIVNISDHYDVTGKSRVGDKYTVVINGRFLSQGDSLDGMAITKITPNSVFLEKEDIKYRIDY